MPKQLQRGRWLWAILATGIVLACAVLLINRRPTVEEALPEAPEVSRADLESGEGGLRLAGATNLFTGTMVETYPGGALRSKSSVSNGVLNGMSEGWHTNGSLEVREFFTNGLSHGLRTKWRPDGGKLSEAQIRAGELHGLFQSWHENGQLAEQLEMRNGKPDGTAISFFPSGFVKGRTVFEGGIVKTQAFWPDQEVRLEQLLPARSGN